MDLLPLTKTSVVLGTSLGKYLWQKKTLLGEDQEVTVTMHVVSSVT